MMNWEQQRDINLAKREQAMEAARLAMAQNAVKNDRTLHNAQATSAQLELFAVAPASYDYVEKLLSSLPSKRQREHFRNVWLRAFQSVADDGSISFRDGNKQATYANNYLREILSTRLRAVFEHYRISVSWLLSRQAYSVELAQQKQVNPEGLHFYLLGERQLKEIACKLSNLFTKLQADFVAERAEEKEQGLISMDDFNRLERELYQLCGDTCWGIGFPLKSWTRFNEGKQISSQTIETELLKIVCDKHWFRTLRTAQKRLIEHLAIGCGEVSAKVSPYISQGAFREFKEQRKSNLEYLKQMIIENIDNPNEQVELLEMWLRSSGNPAIRYNEMMNRLRGVDEWAEENGYISLFLTMTAPSSFHATHNNGTNNKKWQGADPRQTHAYLNKVWQQLRALFAKRGIGFFVVCVGWNHTTTQPRTGIYCFISTHDTKMK
ncbi:replication endonuclease [Aggregatibacter actinomycetemcomitans]|uniref:replication endonuclease n=1 Tax=Aggregatibacter actinomycetemcomitans TaxID=714 RepID=UPI002402CF9A|nr:replication endonuclease [Aggregatibacter actinomycetemcomitans]